LVLAWRNAIEARERANSAAFAACEAAHVQLLDGTVAFRALRVVREARRLHLERTYVFDYTDTGYSRSQGFVVLRGDVVQSVGFAARPEGAL
jgi:hypothetical protein